MPLPDTRGLQKRINPKSRRGQDVWSLARRLAEDCPEADRLRATVSESIAGKAPKKGGILEALRRSPLVGADAIAPRPFEEGREVDL